MFSLDKRYDKVPSDSMSHPFEKFEGKIDPSSPEGQTLQQIDPDKLPQHVAIIMDGNGRWAKQRHLPRVAGHRAGIQAVRSVVETAAQLSIPILTLYAFSAENWKRPREEINTLMELLKEYIRKEIVAIDQNDMKFLAIGRVQELPNSVQDALKLAEERTQNNRGTKLVVALNYSGRLELIDAFNYLIEKKFQSPITEKDVESGLYTVGLSDPDLLIRTSGEIRVSNFLLWQIAYAEIYVTETLWPDFRRRPLLEGVLAYQKRERRYGGIAPAPAVIGAR